MVKFHSEIQRVVVNVPKNPFVFADFSYLPRPGPEISRFSQKTFLENIQSHNFNSNGHFYNDNKSKKKLCLKHFLLLF